MHYEIKVTIHQYDYDTEEEFIKHVVDMQKKIKTAIAATEVEMTDEPQIKIQFYDRVK